MSNIANHALIKAARNGQIPDYATIEDLAKAKDIHGNTGLHLAAFFGHLDQITGEIPAQLLIYRENQKRNTLEVMGEETPITILEKITCQNPTEIKAVATTFHKINPVTTAIWAQQQIEKLQKNTVNGVGAQ